MTPLLVVVFLTLFISFLCSLAEAVLYSVSLSHLETLKNSGRKSGRIFFELRRNVDRPITAILTLNTLSHTAGAAVSGAMAVEFFGHEHLFLFSLIFTAFILFFSEILPKVMGVTYNRKLAIILARPLQWLVILSIPVIWISRFLISFMHKHQAEHTVSEEDLLAQISLTHKAGHIDPREALSMRNILSLDKKIVRDVMTPRMVIFSLPANITVFQARADKSVWPNSRIPVYDDEDPEDIVGLVYRREVLEALANDENDKTLSDLMKPVRFVIETLTLDKLLVDFLESRQHLFVVLDEYGGVAGVVTLEDVLEEILGNEIVDETDEFVDMRELARKRRRSLTAGGESSSLD
ncbi:MAG: HlyC/CorC family transporter [Deltaproteobacteria bacterium]|nr:HlyC/CorC family transporter [Deltaproteobacteria bacterium]